MISVIVILYSSIPHPYGKQKEIYTVYGGVFGFWLRRKPHDQKLPMCLICDNSFSNEPMKPSRLAEHLKKNIPIKWTEPELILKVLRKNFDQHNTLSSYLKKLEQFESGIL